MRPKAQNRPFFFLCIALFLAIAMNVTLWFQIRDTKVEWKNVPPVPPLATALWSSLGDKQLAYRGYGIMVQNMGDTGGISTNVADYDKRKLADWFFLLHELDPDSSHIPRLAGFVFAAQRKDTNTLDPVIDYLETAAGNGEGEKWRFLTRAVFIARFRMNDMDRALELAKKLATFENPNMPDWARQMGVFILTARGEKEAAYDMMVNLLKSSADKLHPTEVNESIYYICTQILNAEEAKQDPLCENIEL